MYKQLKLFRFIWLDIVAVFYVFLLCCGDLTIEDTIEESWDIVDFVTVRKSVKSETVTPPLAVGEPYLKSGPPLAANFKNGWTSFDDDISGYEIFFDGSLLEYPWLIFGANFVAEHSGESRWLDYKKTKSWQYLLSVLDEDDSETWNPKAILVVKGNFEPFSADVEGLEANNGYYAIVSDFSSVDGFSPDLIEHIEMYFEIPEDKKGSIRIVNLWEPPAQ